MNTKARWRSTIRRSHERRSSALIPTNGSVISGRGTGSALDRSRAPVAGSHRARIRKELFAVSGGAALLVSIVSAYSTNVDLPPVPEMSLAMLGCALLLVAAHGYQQERSDVQPAAPDGPPRAARDHARHRIESPVDVAPSAGTDVPSITGEIGVLLAHLRREYGVTYSSRTWVEKVLPSYAATPPDLELARDLLAVAALDAGGVRADVSSIARHHPASHIIDTSRALHLALTRLLTSCQEGALRPSLLPPSDASRWPSHMS